MRPTTAPHDNVIEIDALTHAGRAFEHPREVVSHPVLGVGSPSGMTTTLDEAFARIREHRDNTHRYRQLDKTKLSDLEPQFIQRRLSEEQAALEALTSEIFPVALPVPKESSAPVSARSTP